MRVGRQAGAGKVYVVVIVVVGQGGKVYLTKEQSSSLRSSQYRFAIKTYKGSEIGGGEIGRDNIRKSFT